MLKPIGYDSTIVGGNYTPLPAGGYVCKIMNVEESEIPATAGRAASPLFLVSLDIAEGEHANRYATEYRNDTRQNKKWGCVLRQNIYKSDGSTNSFFKGLITAIEESNGMTVNWCEGTAFADQFKGKLVGMVFGREQYKNQNGELKWMTRPQVAMTVERIRNGDFTTPSDKAYSESTSPVYAPPGQFDNAAVNRYITGTAEPPVSVPPMNPNDLPFTFN